MPNSLPEYEKPPVVEVALSVQFERIEALHTPQLGLVWEAFRERFPKTQEHPPLDPVFEQFGAPGSGKPSATLELLSAFPTPRVWFLAENETELLQVQQDKFVRNWRKRGAAEEYPRYRRLRKSFQEDLEKFCRLVEAQEWGRVEPNQCEVTYVNLIPAGEGWQDHGELERVITVFTSRYSDDWREKLEESAVNVKYVLKDETDVPVGRLHVGAAPVLRLSDKRPAIRLTLTARGKPEGGGIDGVFRFLDRGREAIVRGFTALTTENMHRIWKRIK
jgi:uncharacterized protein (TIGR04255 family)